MSTVRKSAQYYCRTFISINGRLQVHYSYCRHMKLSVRIMYL